MANTPNEPGRDGRSAKSVRVYATGEGRLCPGCGHPAGHCSCQASGESARGDGIVRVRRETRGRKGKGVTLITGVPLGEAGLAALAREFKQRCGTGGAVKEGVIEIQGDHRDRLLDELRARGYRAKSAGG